MGANLSAADCHRLATFFAAKYSTSTKVVVQTPGQKLLMAKLAASPTFSEPAADWERLLDAIAARECKPIGWKCKCNCGCDCLTVRLHHCRGCCNVVCGNCVVPGRYERSSTRCHHCKKLQKREGHTEPPVPAKGFEWYFGFPCDDFGFPDVMCTLNRNTDLDPPLSEVIQLRKRRSLEKDGRNVRPYNWERVFDIQVSLVDSCGAVQLVSMPYFYFIQNPKWKAHPIVKFVERWLRPETFLYLGVVWRYDSTEYGMAREVPQPQLQHVPIAPDAGKKSDEESETDEVKDVKAKEEYKETLRRFEEQDEYNRSIVRTPGVQIEDVEETNDNARAMLGLNCTMDELLKKFPGAEWSPDMVRTMIDRRMTQQDFQLAGLANHELVLKNLAEKDDARVRSMMPYNLNWSDYMESGLGEHRDVLSHFGMTLADVDIETRVAKRCRIE